MDESTIFTSLFKAIVPIIKVVGNFCNLRCRYCFYNTADQLAHHVMSDKLLEKFLIQYMKLFTERLVFIWHGGEPLLAGLSFFQKVVDIQNREYREGQIIKNIIQTNATLIDDTWAEFFKAYDFKVGVSLDGSKKSHDHFRLNHKGEGSFDRVMRGITILRRHGIEPGIIQTLTNNNIPRVKEDFCFFVNDLGIKKWGVNVCYKDEFNEMDDDVLNLSIANKELISFLKTYIDLWIKQGDPYIQIREIENFMAGTLKKRALNCSFNGSCTSYFCLDYDGKIYPCDRFSNSSEFIFGDLSRQNLTEILNSSTRLRYVKDVNVLHSDCVDCEWQNACHNGCSANRMSSIRGKYYFCETRKEIFAYLRNKAEIYRQDCVKKSQIKEVNK